MHRASPVRATITLAIALFASVAGAQTPACPGPSADGYLDCAKQCEEAFYVSENTNPAFAELRSACLVGCGDVPDAAMSAYARCFNGCKALFPYRHGMKPYFADVQESCIQGCRGVR